MKSSRIYRNKKRRVMRRKKLYQSDQDKPVRRPS